MGIAFGKPKVDLDAIRKWNLRPDGYVLYAGRIVPEKRLHLLLEAWGGIDTDRVLVVAGQFSEAAYERTCRRRAAAGNVLFLGPQYGDVLTELYSNASVLVHPSVLEGMSLVLLEAADLACCILAADIPANRGTLGDSILYFNMDKASQLQEQLCRSLSSKALRSEFGKQARQLVRRQFSWSASAERMERIYRKVLKLGRNT